VSVSSVHIKICIAYSMLLSRLTDYMILVETVYWLDTQLQHPLPFILCIPELAELSIVILS